MLKVLGKLIKGSSLETIFVQSGMYGSSTVAQILDGKHMKRGAEAHTVLYLALSKLYHSHLIKTKNFIIKNGELQTVNAQIELCLSEQSNLKENFEPLK